MTRTVIQPCWRVWALDKATLRWTVWSEHPTHTDAADAAEYLYHRQGLRTRISQGRRHVAVASQAPAPTEAKAFRESQADAVVLRRQTHAYFKSGCNGNEILSE